MNPTERYADLADRLEAELRRLGSWDMPRPPDEAFQSRVAFFGDTMALHQWLQWVLVERLRQIVRGEMEPPPSSSVGTYAIRDLDGDPDAEGLIDLLIELDDLINGEEG